jgi:hypothetical protein
MQSTDQLSMANVKIEYQRAIAMGLHLGILRAVERIVTNEEGEENIAMKAIPTTLEAFQQTMGQACPLYHLHRAQEIWLAHLKTLQERIKEQQQIDRLKKDMQHTHDTCALILGVIESNEVDKNHTPQELTHLQVGLCEAQEGYHRNQEALQAALQRASKLDLILCAHLIGMPNGLFGTLNGFELLKQAIQQSAHLRSAYGSQIDFLKICDDQDLELIHVPFSKEGVRQDRQELKQHLDRLTESEGLLAIEEQLSFQHVMGRIKLAIAWLDDMTELMQLDMVNKLTSLERWRIGLSAGVYRLLAKTAWEGVVERLAAIETAAKAEAKAAIEAEASYPSSPRPC